MPKVEILHKENFGRTLYIDNEIWAFEFEYGQYNLILFDLPKGDCLEIGLGLGTSARAILNYPVKSLTTVEVNQDVIDLQKKECPIKDIRHSIVHMEGLEYLNTSSRTFDFIWIDIHNHLDKYDMMKFSKAAKQRLNENGKLAIWTNPSWKWEDIKWCRENLDIR